MGLKDQMTWSHGDKQKRTLAYLDSGIADKHGKKYIMINEDILLSQEANQYLE